MCGAEMDRQLYEQSHCGPAPVSIHVPLCPHADNFPGIPDRSRPRRHAQWKTEHATYIVAFLPNRAR